MNRFPIFRNGGIVYAGDGSGIKIAARELELLIFKNLKKRKLLEKLKELEEASKKSIKDTREFYGTGLNKKNAAEINKKRKQQEAGNYTTRPKNWGEDIDYLPSQDNSRNYISGLARVPWLDFYDLDGIEWWGDLY